MGYIHSTDGDFGETLGFAEPPITWRARRTAEPPGPLLRYPPFETIVGFVRNNPALNGWMLDVIKRVAEFIGSAEEILKRALAASDLPGKVQEPIRKTVRGIAKTPVR